MTHFEAQEEEGCKILYTLEFLKNFQKRLSYEAIKILKFLREFQKPGKWERINFEKSEKILKTMTINLKTMQNVILSACNRVYHKF